MEDSHHRRIELQSPADLQFLEGNVTRAARARVDLHLPPSAAPEGEDELRMRVEKEVSEFVRKTFVGARQSISINGMPVPETMEVGEGGGDVEEFEPFDERLRDDLASLEANKQALTERVARLRRSAPRQAAQNFEAAFTAYDEGLQRDQEQGNKGAKDNSSTHPDIHGLKRGEEVAATWKEALEKLKGVSEGLPGTMGRLERGAEAVEYLNGGKGGGGKKKS